jgi:hypothetical protein
MNNDTIDKLAEVYAGDEEDAKAYQKAQASVVVNLTRQNNELRKKLEEMSSQLETLTIENTKLKALGNGTEIQPGNDAETICLVQLALLNNYSMQRELTLEETKKAEIFTKSLLLLRGKQEKRDEAPKISDAELMAALKDMGA